MTDERLFDLDEIPEVPLLPARRRRDRARGIGDARFLNDYPPDWHRCGECSGFGYRWTRDGGRSFAHPNFAVAPDQVPHHGDDYGTDGAWEAQPCPACLGMGSLKARVRLEAGHRCVRCQHPYVPKADAAKLGIEPSYYRFSHCDAECVHQGPLFERFTDDDSLLYQWEPMPDDFPQRTAGQHYARGRQPYAEWRILTVHHLDGDKANCAWWNLVALCQRCHLEIQAKVVLERIYPHEHTEWFRPYAAGWYAHAYLGEDLSREEVKARMDELLALERA